MTGLPMPYQIFLVEDHPVMRDVYTRLLRREADFDLCGVADSAEQALSAADWASCDLLVTDLSLPGTDGVALPESLGADAAVDGKGDGVAEAVRQFAPDGLDAALVAAQGDSLDAVLAAVRRGGRVAWPHGVMPEPEPPEGVEGQGYDGTTDQDALEAVNDLIETRSGDLPPFRVHVARTFALDEVPEAERALDDHYLGKLAVTVAD